MSKQYQTPAAYRAALEQRQKQRAADHQLPFDRIIQTDLYFRFLDRLVHELGERSFIVKGGVALELRLQRARTTRDLDLCISGSPRRVYEQVREAGQRQLRDHLVFHVEEQRGERPIEGDGVIYEGRRFSVQAMMANRKYGSRFGVDVVLGDSLYGQAESVSAPDEFAFVGISPPTISLYPLGAHLAEKLHAYTMPRWQGRPNSRLKDLIDIALVAAEPALKPSPEILAMVVRESMESTFRCSYDSRSPRSSARLSTRVEYSLST